MTRHHVAGVWILAAFLSFCAASAPAQDPAPSPMQIEIDVRDLARNLVHAKLTLPITPVRDAPHRVTLWYPKWVPGSHGPGGPIQNVAGLEFQANGQRLSWVRTPGEIYRLEVEVPAGADRIHVSMRYIANQPSTNSFGHDCFGSSEIGVVGPGTVLLYREGVDIDSQRIAGRLLMPEGWHVASALLPDADGEDSGNTPVNSVSFQAVSLRSFVDSPIMCGAHYRSFDLVEANHTERIPPHTLHVFGDDAVHADLNEGILGRFRTMVTQTALLVESHPFDRFDILLGISDVLPANGLEHSRSTFNVLPVSALQSPASLKGWNRLLVPHEYLHAWCGKYRRPEGMLTSDFHTPKDTSLLWVYEGLTQYLGEVIEARCGLMTEEEFRHRLTVELRHATHVQGRQWRTLADTGSASYILRSRSPHWGGLRRSQDYYMEGMLFWLEADARIRLETDGARSLDDFCRSFLGSDAGSPHPRSFTRQDVVDQLGAVADLDWDGLIGRRVESYQEQFDPSLADLLGYEFRLTREPPRIPPSTFRRRNGVDALDSLGALFSNSGEVRDVLLGSPADEARLRPDLQILGVNGRTWSGTRLREALDQGRDGRPIELLVVEGDKIRTIQVHYYDGPRYGNLVRRDDAPDLLEAILKPK